MMLDRYNIRNIYTGQLAETGYPRIDSTVAPRSEHSAYLRQRLNLDENKPVILFAPTWRGKLNDWALDFSQLDADLSAMRQADAQVVFRGHYFLEQHIAEQSIDCTTVPSDIDSNELLAIVDVLVTDYSSICVDFLPRQKPIIYYAYDQEEYAEERGFYILPEEMPGTFCRERESMVTALHEAVRAINATPANTPVCHYDLSRFNSHDDGEATRRTIDFFFHGDTVHVVHDEKSIQGRCNTLIWGGAIQPNGITSALRTLVHNLDRKRVNPVLAFQPGSIEGKPEREAAFAQFDSTLDVLPRVGPQRLTARESRYLGQAQRQQYAGLSPAQEKTLTAAARREFMRLTGHSCFDVVIDYSGYGVYWSRLFALAAQDARRVIYLHNDMRGEQYGKYFNLPATFNLYQRYDALVSVSASSGEVNRANLALAYNINPSRFVAVENVFDAAAVRHRAQNTLLTEDAALFEKRGPVFINIGRLSLEKDHAKLIHAFAAVAAQHESARLLIMGDGPLRAELEQLIATLDMRNQIFLLGVRDNPMPLLARADCFVLSSNHEGLPVVIFEAMALGVPVISTDITGLRTALDNGGGQVVENTEAGLRDAMHAFSAGKLDIPPAPDLDKYRDEALSAFYDKVLALPDLNNTESIAGDEAE
jgi:CDP-glycerol glycerophosphotransferase